MKKNLQNGIAQLVILSIMGLLAVVLPIATKLVQQNQENRSQAQEDPEIIFDDLPKVCTPNTGKKCENGKLSTCNADGLGWKTPINCVTGACKSDTACSTVQKVGEKCASTYKSCNAAGVAWYCKNGLIAKDDCTAKNQDCKNGACVPKQVCTPNTGKKCENGKLSTCNADGLGWKTPINCVTGACKSDTACSTVQKVGEKCASTYKSCNAAGVAWYCKNGLIAKDDCTAKNQDCKNGACVPKQVCIAGEKMCTDTLGLKECNSAGTDWKLVPCPWGCDFTKNVCKSGTNVCGNYGTLTECNNAGCSWSYSGNYCQVCTNNTQYKCDGRNLMKCNSSGSGWDISRECGIDQTCNATTKTCESKVGISCSTEEEDCDQGYYCDPTTKKCKVGCETIRMLGRPLALGAKTCGNTGTSLKNTVISCSTTGKLDLENCPNGCIQKSTLVAECKSSGGNTSGGGDTSTPSKKPKLYYYRKSTNTCIESQFYSTLDSCKKAQNNKCYTSKSECEKNITSTPTIGITAISLSPDPLNLKVGESGQINVETVPIGLNVEYILTNADGNIAELTSDGMVTGKNLGETEITATVKGTTITDTLKVVVSEDSSVTSDASISFKVAFAGIGADSSTCISEYFIPETRLNLEVNNVPTNKFVDDIQTTFEVVAGEFNTKGNQVFKVTQTLDKDKFGSVNNFNYVKVKGPWHLKRRMCQDGQENKLPETTICEIDLKAGDTKVYDFSEYTLLAGDIFTDGIINTLDLSYIKTRLNPGAEPTCGTEGDLNLDGVVNSFDLNLTKDSLTERDDE